MDLPTPRNDDSIEQTGMDNSRSVNPRDVEIACLQRELDKQRIRERVARADKDQLHQRLTLLSLPSTL